VKIIVDAMGGDFAPLAPVKGALMAQEKYGVDIVLTGKTEEILKALQQCGCKELPKGMEIANATEVVEICDDPATAFKHKKDSSLTVGLNMLHAGDADGFSLLYYQDVDSLVYWANEAAYRWGLRGIAIWSLGQEDMRLWEVMPKQI